MALQLVTLSEANQYFGAHMHAEAWDKASSAGKNKALAHAERHILNLSLAGTPPTQIYKAAVFEQALFLLETTEADRERRRARAAGINFRWVGNAREDYRGQETYTAPEAELLLQNYIVHHRRLGGIR